MNVTHTLSDIDVALLAEALQLLPLGRVQELYARLTVTHGQANQAAMQELAEARAAKAAPAAEAVTTDPVTEGGEHGEERHP